MCQLLFYLLVFTFLSPAQVMVIVKEINYVLGDTSLTGYITYDDALEGKRSGILVVYELC